MSHPDDPVRREALQHLDSLYTLARWLTRDARQAEDLVQETFLRALRFAHQFTPGTNLRAWMFQILRNLHLTARKRWVRDQALFSVPAGGAEGGLPGPGAPNLPAPARGEVGAALDLDAALHRLPEEFRTAVLLADLLGYSMAEVAQIQGCPVGTVKSRLFRARGMLREMLKDYRS
ncbi:MAG: RNA polymerase subunit sigma-24 [candidate division NC10 bacterium]|nr:RNA polymerase subunit sigma-24 [candidate division NC10 bacterium]